MATVLIPTIPDDMHAAAVACVLERLGHRAIRWRCADFPERSTISVAPDAGAQALVEVADAAGTLTTARPDVFWNRRIAPPVIGPGLPDGDRRFALRESAILLAGALDLAARDSFAVNPMSAATHAENKVLQLVEARALGFRLPATLISNDPRRIRTFLREHRAGGTVFKAFRPVTWESHDRYASLYTARVTEAMLPDDALLRASPGIFQAYVPKACELRITCMGGELMAARLDSQATSVGQTDWRLADVHDLSVMPAVLPAEVQERCRALLRRLGLVFGCIDLIVTPEGDHVFLEINQMGQFLWVEEVCPAIPMLQTFCDFLLSRDATFRRIRGRAHRFSFDDVKHEADALLEAERHRHVRAPREAHVVHE
jgi:hypothetical protein